MQQVQTSRANGLESNCCVPDGQRRLVPKESRDDANELGKMG
jgi:hypothetical protein